ncbi:MAG: VanZ family protein, partial [Lachnospiraceae bacterium]|nr:VanZ family protein [Lachnospiraceae bacterium]
MIKTFLRALLKPFSFLPAICMMCMSFSFSSQDGTASASLSYEVSEIIVDCANESFEMNWSESEVSLYIEKIHPYVRKLAHVTEYFLLSVSVSYQLYFYGVLGLWLPVLACG